MIIGDNLQLLATIIPSNATNKGVTWSSSSTSVASVDAGGLVTTKSSGTTSIIVLTEDGNKTAFVLVTVKAKEVPVG